MSAVCQTSSDLKYELHTSEELHGGPTKNPAQAKVSSLERQMPGCPLDEITKIPAPEPRQISIETDWYHVLGCIYYRTTGKYLPITKGQFSITSHGHGIVEYENCPTQKASTHCEITLMRSLTYVHKRSPTGIGVSTACWPLCFEFIRAVNENRATYSQTLWKVRRSHGSVCNWSLEEDEDKSMLTGTAAV